MLLAIYFVMVIALPLALGGYVVYNGLPRSRRCPLCAHETIRLRAPVYRVASRAFRRQDLHRRWCPACDWSGAARIGRAPAGAVATALAGAARHVPDTRRAGDSVDIRRLEVDGRAVRVMVQCWAEGGEWRGRLLFIGTDGQTWMEGSSSIRGGSALEVLSQALTLPDRALAGRLRQVMS